MASLNELQQQLAQAQLKLQRLSAEAAALAQEYTQAGSPVAGPIYDAVVAKDRKSTR